jgi:hypothetical protein
MPDPDDVVGAVEAVAAGGPIGADEPGALIRAEVLDAGADQIGRNADPVHALARWWLLAVAEGVLVGRHPLAPLPT